MLNSLPQPRRQILVVDDDEFSREGVRLYLTQNNFEIVEAADEATAWKQACDHRPAAAVVDIAIPPDPETPVDHGHVCGIQLAQRLKQSFPEMGVVLFSAYEDRGREILELIYGGTRGIGYQLKGNQPKALLAAIYDVLAGRVVLDPEMELDRHSAADDLLARLTPDERPWVDNALRNLRTLTPREEEVAQRLAASHNTEGIAQALNVTPKTAENYIGHVYDKLGLGAMKHEAPHLRQVVVLAKAYMVRDLKPEP